MRGDVSFPTVRQLFSAWTCSLQSDAKLNLSTESDSQGGIYKIPFSFDPTSMINTRTNLFPEVHKKLGYVRNKKPNFNV